MRTEQAGLAIFSHANMRRDLPGNKNIERNAVVVYILVP